MPLKDVLLDGIKLGSADFTNDPKKEPHVVANLTKAINQLKSEGIEMPDELLKYISPYRIEHINRLGYLALNMDKVTQELEYDINK